jgi:hypothetical protein
MRNCEAQLFRCLFEDACDCGDDSCLAEFTLAERTAAWRSLERRGIIETYLCPRQGEVTWRATGKGAPAMCGPAKLELDS